MILYQINGDANYGSTGKIAEALGKMVIQRGGEAYLAHGRKHRPSALVTYKVGNSVSHAFHLLLTRIFDRHGLGSYYSTQKMIRHMDKVKPTIVHLHNIHGYYLHYPSLFRYLEKKGVPVVWTLHDCWTFTGHCTHFENSQCTKWQSHCQKCPQKNVYPSSWVADRSFKNFRDKKKYFLAPSNIKVITVSNWLKSVAKQSILSKHDIRTIHNGVDVDVFKPMGNDHDLRMKYGLEGKKIILGVASVWSKNKGLEDFIKLSRLIKPDEKIVLIGLNKQQLDALPKSILGIRRTSDVFELAQWYSSASVYLNPSVEETFGMTSAEALACGTPIVVYNSTACPEMVSGNVGYVVRKNDISELRIAIDKIISNTHIDYGTNCRERVLKNFNMIDRRMDYLKLYEEIQLAEGQYLQLDRK